jgi:5,10-methylenetetrahydrofolate reductase
MIEITFNDIQLIKWIGSDLWKISYDAFIGQPYFKFEGEFYAFRDKLHSWFIEHKIEYSFVTVTNFTTTLRFQKESDAVLFKLIWL